MKKEPKRYYEVFNMETGNWEEKLMTSEQYEQFENDMNASSDEINAEYEIITRIVSQEMGAIESDKKSMD